MPSVDLFQNFFSNLGIYFDQDKTRPLKRILMYAYEDGNTFPCVAQPNQVRRFNSQYPNGLLLTLSATPNNINQYTWSNQTVIISPTNPLTPGEYLVAYSAGEELFENQETVSGLQRFYSNSDNQDDRTKVQRIYIFNESTNKRYIELVMTVAMDFVPSVGLEPAFFTFSIDGQNWQENNILIPDIQPGQFASVYIKCVIPKGTITGNLRDVAISVAGFEEQI